ncbi:MAG: Uridylate kinase [Microgenomates group bacterium GW2011_GWC1_39_7b]|uniref:Uridylate kinase n=3 Tax=Candidatus Woeseibacteriota TaxID=1752722 RepID=A0A0G0LJB5_9BACT|nr:MAG: Uridylate kinase [Candidatus Woesebacteria bacterium GW2011_GWB1_39_10]KKR26980.1 MAG: Uridylate kinase [Microgenomates group bacterium GW2011_GWC1_39_7b]KKR72009.1 MAG: Uridylate kinase [Candidatus Woesebacteria bacterium GW2011_GWA2_40_7]KKS90973.1 MAG: Uridylate kinase [Candidatus Woesebacteria bacterium GW2011_GWA1_43_12]
MLQYHWPVNKKLKYKRVLLKLSGELFGEKDGKGIGFENFERIAEQIYKIWKTTGVELTIVVGGGNIFRGRERSTDVDEASADYIGMLGTIINGIALQDALERTGAPTRMMTAFEIKSVAEPYIRRRAIRHIDKGRIVIFTAGTGNPFFTTDSGAALRAIEMHCDVILKATNVDGVYSEDPKANPNATFYEKLTYQKAIEKNLKVMDATAFALCQKHNMPIIVFNINKLKNLDKILQGEKTGTLVS